MALIPWKPKESWWDPFKELEDMHRQMDRLFGLSLPSHADRQAGLMEGAWNPAVDIYDSKDSVLVKADIPGMKKQDLEISVEDQTLYLKGEKKEEKKSEDAKKGYVRSERFYGSFRRAIPLGCAIDQGKVSARYRDGVLEVTLPKKEEAKPTQVKIDIA